MMNMRQSGQTNISYQAESASSSNRETDAPEPSVEQQYIENEGPSL